MYNNNALLLIVNNDWLLKVLENMLCDKMQYTTEKEFHSFWQVLKKQIT